MNSLERITTEARVLVFIFVPSFVRHPVRRVLNCNTWRMPWIFQWEVNFSGGSRCRSPAGETSREVAQNSDPEQSPPTYIGRCGLKRAAPGAHTVFSAEIRCRLT
jgi:hypothetical protein